MSAAFILDNDSSLNDAIRAQERLRWFPFFVRSLCFYPSSLSGCKAETLKYSNMSDLNLSGEAVIAQALLPASTLWLL